MSGYANKVEYIENIRHKVLMALDEAAFEYFQSPNGAYDRDLPEIFRCIDAHALKLAERYEVLLVD